MTTMDETDTTSETVKEEPIADVRYSFCKAWVEKQNREGSKKLSQQNKNDIQFIIQTNADRKKFLLSAAEDEATVPVGVGEPSVEPKAVKLQLLRKDVRMECEWLSCNLAFEDYREFQTHCRNHISDLQVTDEKGKIVYTCLWDACKHKNSDFDEICRHVNYHAYHARLLCIGFNARATMNLARCKKDSTNRNKLPLLNTDFCCMWVGCDVKFKSMQAFLDHVPLHTCYSPWLCSWAGCGASFPRRALLATHIRAHTGERIVACYHCGHHFASNRKLRDHLHRQNVVPSNENTCSVCGFSYGTEYLLRQHARQHVSQHACTLCDMSAPTLATLAQHVRYRHLPEHCRAHQCDRCYYKAITKSDLRKHMKTHNRKSKRKEDSDFSAEDSDDNPRKKKKVEKKYACHMCAEKETKVFSRGSLLTSHLVKVHGAQWPFGHSRFRYQISEDGMYRLTTTRYEILEVSKKIVDGYSGPKDSLSNTFEFNLEEKAKATSTTPTRFEITLKSNEDLKKGPKLDENTVEITMCDVDEEGNIICSENEEEIETLTKRLKQLEKEIKETRRNRRVSSSSSCSNGSSCFQRSVSTSSASQAYGNNPNDRNATAPAADNQPVEQSVAAQSLDTEPIPGPSDSAQQCEAAYAVESDEDGICLAELRKILGSDPTQTQEFGEDINKDVASGFEHIATLGLEKQARQDLLEKYLVPSNCRKIAAPQLNPEIKATSNKNVVKRDKSIEFRQKQMAAAITGIGRLLTSQLTF